MKPPWPYRISRRAGGDGVARVRRGVFTRLLHLDETAVVVHCWQPAANSVRLRAVGAGPETASTETLEQAIARMRFALGVDDDLSPFYATFRSDPLVGPAVRRRPWQRPRRRPWPWEALAWAITEQLIEVSRATEIQRRMVRRWGRKLEPGSGDLAVWRGPGPLRDVPTADAIAARGPAELAAIDLAPARSLALIKCAREVGRRAADLFDRSSDARLLRISRDRPLDGPVPRPLRSRRPRLAAGGRSRLREAGRLPRRARPPRQRRGGRGVLRPLRAVSRPRRQLRARALGAGDGIGAAGVVLQRGPCRLSGSGPAALLGDLPRQVLVGQHLGGARPGRDQAAPGKELGEVGSTPCRPCSRTACPGRRPRAAAASPRSRPRSASRSRPSPAARITSVAAAGSAIARLGAALERGDEQPDRLRVSLEHVAVGDEHELVVGRDAELVDRQSPSASRRARRRSTPSTLQEAAEHRVGAAARAPPAAGRGRRRSARRRRR